MTEPRVLIVGAGPAGTRAAEALVSGGVRPVVVDEAPQSGGQIYRRPPPLAGFVRPARALYGPAAAKATALHAAFDALCDRIDYRPETVVWGLGDGVAHGLRRGICETIPFDRLILATGAMDRVIPFPGWTTPGVFTLGGAQIALKHQGCAVGRRTVFLGTGPLLYLVAWQYAKAGAEVAAVLDVSPVARRIRELPRLAAGGRVLMQGVYYMAWLVAHGVRLETAIRPVAVQGGDAVAALSYRDAAGREHDIPCDAVAFGYGLKPETQLADLAGCRFRFDEAGRHWLPETDSDGRALGIDGVYLAGDGAGIGGADAAELAGERAALTLLADLGRPADGARLARIERRLARLARFRAGLERAFPFPAELAAAIDDATILCRCEEVTAGELRATARGMLAGDEINRAKAFTRIGMGRCQGRVCGPAAQEVLAAALALSPDGVGRLRGQPPIKPVSVAALATGCETSS